MTEVKGIISAGRQDVRRLSNGARMARHAGAGLLLLALSAIAPAQGPGRSAFGSSDANPTVTWTLSPVSVAKNAHKAVINVHASIREGWHVYSLKQSATGPTPLIVSIDKNDVAIANGAPSGNKPTAVYEPAFESVTPYYLRTINLTVPIRFRGALTPGRRTVPVSVRYQSCDGRICEPPKTVRLNATVDVRAES